jgi:ABC-type polysaccharide/polyol phosphate export permease
MKLLTDMFIIFWRDIRHYVRWKLHFVFDIIFPLLDFIVFMVVWSAILKGGFEGIGMLNSQTYIIFLLSGFILWRFIDVALGRDVTHSFIREKYRQTMPYLLTSPISTLAIPYGTCILALIRSSYSSVILLVIGLLFFNLFVQGNIFLTMLIIFLTFLGFSGIGLVIAALASWREDFADLSYLLSYILMIASGISFPLEILPENIKNILMIIPSSQAAYAIRAILIENAGFVELLPIMFNLLIFSAITLSMAVFSFKFVKKKAMLIGI